LSLVLCCRDATARLTEGAEGALSGAEGATFAFHLTICPSCKAYREQLETTVGVLQAMPRETAKAEDVDAILRMLGDAARTSEE
jgi:anti-sigma factor ChrR (cupin superfamily)